VTPVSVPHHGFKRFLFLAQGLGALGVVPDFRVFQLPFSSASFSALVS
jgi:hypothetical protein